ncbi:MAG: aldehyde-activating protein [Rhizobiaceae bacterium]|nr:aldehyde-activating protein [Rhizobiaceae bacterium]
MTSTTIGSCLCGDVKFQISGAFESFFLCHCRRCRKDTGSAHAANLFSSTATLSWISGLDNVQTYKVPGTRHEKSFCARCGSAVPSVQMEGALVVVPAGSLDSAIENRPSAHICLASRAEWDARLEDIPKFDGLPG